MESFQELPSIVACKIKAEAKIYFSLGQSVAHAVLFCVADKAKR